MVALAMGARSVPSISRAPVKALTAAGVCAPVPVREATQAIATAVMKRVGFMRHNIRHAATADVPDRAGGLYRVSRSVRHAAAPSTADSGVCRDPCGGQSDGHSVN